MIRFNLLHDRLRALPPTAREMSAVMASWSGRETLEAEDVSPFLPHRQGGGHVWQQAAGQAEWRASGGITERYVGFVIPEPVSVAMP
jgi:hypothetical protein